MLRSLVAKAAPAPPPYEVNAPATLIANLTEENVRVLHLMNWTGDKLERPGPTRITWLLLRTCASGCRFLPGNVCAASGYWSKRRTVKNRKAQLLQS